MRTPLLVSLLAAAAAPAGAEPAAKVTLTYLGVAGWQLTDGRHVVLVDPYFSRPSLDGDDPLVPDERAIEAHAPPRADLILVGHSHFDHVLDVPSIARRTGAQVMGSESTARLARAAGVPGDHIIPIQGGEDYELDGFSVRVIPSLHSALGDKHIAGGRTLLPADVKLPLPADGYVEGGTFAYLVRMGGHEVLFLGTANYIEREVEGLRPDVAVVAVGLREEIHDYTCRLMRALGRPRLVLANHFDAWTKPLGPAQMDLDAGARASLDRFPAEVRACAPSTRTVIPKHLAPIALPARRARR